MRIAVIGGGISGMATAYSIQELAKVRGQEATVFVVEKEARLGGKIQTDNIDGWLCENGPVGYVDSKPEVAAVVNDLELTDSLVRANEAAAKRYVWVDRRLQQVPLSPPAFLKSPLLSWGGKFRILRELWTKAPAAGADESIAQFARRHLGDEVADKLISAMVVGVFAGDADKLSIESAFPVMLELEKEGNGSLIRAQMGRRKAKRATTDSEPERPKSEGMVGSSGTLTTFRRGMNQIIDAIRERFEGEIKRGNGARRLAAEDGGYSIDLEDGFKLAVDAVVFSSPAYATAAVLREFDEELSKEIGDIPYVPVNVVVLGYPAAGFEHDLDGFGFVIPKREKRDILGCLWNTSIFKGQAPDGKVSLRAMVGGGVNPEAALYDDTETLDVVQRELRTTMGITKDPEFTRIIRHEKAIPQYMVGHRERLARIDARVERHAGLFITGNAYRGVSFNDCVINAGKTAERVLEYAAR